MKSASFAILAAVAAAPFAGGVAHAAPTAPAAAPAKAKLALPVVANAKSLTKDEKAGVSGEGLIDLNVTALNNLSLLNNLNLLNIGSFNKWIKTSNSGGGCGCGYPS